jgi:hypothetical protein
VKELNVLNSVHIIDCRPEAPYCSTKDESACKDFTFFIDCPRKCGKCRELLITLSIAIECKPYLLVEAAPPLPKQRGGGQYTGGSRLPFSKNYTSLRKLCVIHMN